MISEAVQIDVISNHVIFFDKFVNIVQTFSFFY